MKRLATVGCTLSCLVAAQPAVAATYLSDYEIPVVRGINAFGAPVLDLPMGVLSNDAFVALAPIGLAVAEDPNGFTAPLLVVTSDLAAYAAVSLLKPLFHRARPYVTYPDLRTPNGQVPDDPASFPSGHATLSFAAATAVADFNPAYALPAYGFATLVSYSRVYNGVHYPSDVLVGALLGVGIGKLTRWGYDRVKGRYGFETALVQPTADFSDGLRLGFAGRF